MKTLGLWTFALILSLVSVCTVRHAAAQGYDLVLEPRYTPGNEFVVFGYVQDQNGDLLANVIVRIEIRGEGVTYVERTDYRGRYRRPGLNPALEASDFVISCEKAGFRQVRVMKMKAPGKVQGIVEANCTLERLDS